jgi:hypothetical protein
MMREPAYRHDRPERSPFLAVLHAETALDELTSAWSFLVPTDAGRQELDEAILEVRVALEVLRRLT